MDISPDGQWVAFDLLGHIYRMPVSGGEATVLTQNSGVALNFHPRISPDGKQVFLATGAIGYPNGIAFSPDEKLLYVNDTRVNKVYVHDVKADGSISETREWVQLQGNEAGNADGMKVDSEGNVWTSGPGGIHILDSSARVLGRIRFPNHVSNLCWGGEDWKTLFITDHHQVYRTRDARHVVVGAVEPKFWRRFSQTAGHPEWEARQSEPLPQHRLMDAAQHGLTAVQEGDERAPERHAGDEGLGAVDRIEHPGELGVGP